MNPLNIGERLLGSNLSLQFEQLDRKGNQIIFESTNLTEKMQTLFCGCILRVYVREKISV
jgi:hypothetical protein